MAEFVFEFLRFADGPVVQTEIGSAPDLKGAHLFAQIGLYNVNARKLATTYRLRDPMTGEILATGADAPPPPRD